MSAAPWVVVIGDLVTDVVAHLEVPLAAGSDAPAAIRTTGGGSGANVAAWLATAGASVAFVGRVGADDSGRLRTQELREAGVAVRTAIDETAATGTVVVLVDDGGERTMVPDRGANLRLSPADLPAEVFRDGGHLHLSGYVLLDDGPRPAGLAALRRARETGMTVSVDPSSVQPLLAAGIERWLEWTAGADLCLPNRQEAAVLTGTDDLDRALARLCSHYGEVVITAGAEGAVWSDGQRRAHCPAVAAAVRDTTGAGDAFTAGYLAARLAGDDAGVALEHGCRLAAAAVGDLGGRPAPVR